MRGDLDLDFSLDLFGGVSWSCIPVSACLLLKVADLSCWLMGEEFVIAVRT